MGNVNLVISAGEALPKFTVQFTSLGRKLGVAESKVLGWSWT